MLLRKQDVGLYLDDGLAVVKNINGPKLDKLRKKIITIVKAENFCITMKTDLIETDLSDVIFNLHTGKYFPYCKHNNDPLYINIQSKYLNTIKKKKSLDD